MKDYFLFIIVLSIYILLLVFIKIIGAKYGRKIDYEESERLNKLLREKQDRLNTLK